MSSLNKTILVVFFLLFLFSVVYSQETMVNKEIDEAIMNAKTGNCDAAIPVLERYSKNKSLDDLEILNIYVNLNHCYFFADRELFAIDKINILLDSYINKYGVSKGYQLRSADEIDIIFAISLMNIEMKNYEKSIAYLLILKDIYEEIYYYDQTYFDILELLLNLFNETNDFVSAISVGQKAQSTSTTIYGYNDETQLSILIGLHTAYANSYNHEMALQCLMKMEKISKNIYGERSEHYLTILNNLYSFYSEIGSFQESLEINKKVIALRKAIAGTRDPNYLNDMANMAVTYINLGEFISALEINQEISEIQRDVLGVNAKAYLSTMCNLANNYCYIGNYERAFELFNTIMPTIKETIGEKSREYLLCLGSLSNVYSETGNYQKALEILLELVESQKELFGTRDPHYLTSLNNLAICYSRLKKYQKSLEINQLIVDIRKYTLGEKHFNYLVSLGNLARDYSFLKSFPKALEIHKKVVESMREVLGEKHPDYFKAQGNLAGTEYDLSDFKSAFNHFQIMLKGLQDYLVSNFVIMTEQQRGQLWNSWYFSFAIFPLFLESIAINQYQNAEYSYDVSLFTKELLLNIASDFNEIIVKNGTAEAYAKFEELKLLKIQILRLHEKPIRERFLNTDSLENIAQQKETELIKLSKEYGDFVRNLKISWKDVQKNLRDNDVAIEFVEYPTLSDTVKYAALVLRKGWKYPIMVPLFHKDQIEVYIKQNLNQIYSNEYVGKEIRKFVWNPLEEYISIGDRVYFSPAGILHQLAIENLPVNDSTTLGDQYQMYRLSSTKELVIKNPEISYETAVLYGGLNYDIKIDSMLMESNKYPKIGSLYAMRGYSNDTTSRSGWDFLNGTLPEVHTISQKLKEKGFKVKQYSGNSGNEESFKALSGTKPGIIHIASHGFFLPIEESNENLYVQMRLGDLEEKRGWVDPMLRSGL